MIEFLLWPALALVVLTGMHCYLGLHVVKRGIIFIDLALAQLAALGWVSAVAWGLDPHDQGIWVYLMSLAFALTGAVFFSFVRSRKHDIPQEAIIGITYAVASAAAILVISRVPQELSITDMLTRDLLLVAPDDVLHVAILYAVVGGIHAFLRTPLYEISEDVEAARANGRKVWAWDLLFYGTFAVVVTSSVLLTGILLVFALLVAPAVGAMLLAVSMRARLLAGWGLGMIGGLLGLVISWYSDLPMSTTIVCSLGALLLLVAVGSTVLGRMGSSSRAES